MAVKELTNSTFDQAVKDNKWMVIDFYATWCAPCSMLSQIIEKVSEEFEDVAFYKVDIDDNMELASNFHVVSIPTLLFFKDGEAMNEVVGYVPEDQLADELKKTFV
ncbi:MAG: thioredoxin [Anaerostipes sp.]|nr:thioredoxin [Anaerostipes sp.]